MPEHYIDAIDDELHYERCETFGGGMDNYNHPTLLEPTQYQYGLNIFIPDSLDARTRPGADRVGTARAAKIQGLFYFDTPTVEQLITASNGVLYEVGSALDTWTQMNGWTLNDPDARFSAAQGIDKVLFADGTTLAAWDGTTFTTYNALATDPPTGASILVWHVGRMWAAGFPGSGTAGKEDDAICVSAFLTFGNGDWDRTDRSFRVGRGEGDPIMTLLSVPAAVPELSVLFVGKQNSIHVLRTDPTSAFTNMSQTVNPDLLSPGIGVVGKRAAEVFGNDVLFIATDKTFRSMAKMTAAAGQYEAGPPLSTPLQPLLDRVNWTVQSLFTVTRYRHFALFSVALDTSTTPNTVFAWNTHLSRWMGVWTGWTPNCWETTRFNGVTRLMHGDNSGNVRQWKDYADATDDLTYLDDGLDIATELWVRSFLFQEPLNNKDAFYLEARFSSSNAVVDFKFMGDNVQLKEWTADLRPTGPNLEIDLEFDLENPTNIPTRRGLRDLPDWNECFVKVSSASGWWSLRNMSLAAYLNTLKNQ